MTRYLNEVRAALRGVFGRADRRQLERAAHALAARDMSSVTAAVAAHGLSVRTDDSARPLFLLAAGWRSGSTFLQRLCMSAGRRLMWGEPYDAACLVQGMRAQLRPFSSGWPARAYFVDQFDTAHLDQQWVANLYPVIDDLWHAHRAFFDRLFAAPANACGYAEWGLKEVRLSAADAAYLKWIYPHARLLFLVRNPYDAWASYRARNAWFAAWPDRIVDTPWRFGRLWRHLATSYAREHAALGAMLLHYEDLGEAHTQLRLAEFLDQPRADPTTLAVLDGDAPRKTPLPAVERHLLSLAVAGAARGFGYRGPSAEAP